MNHRPILYIFLHMPKCAGSTFTYHVRQNLHPHEYLDFYASDFCFDTHRLGIYYLQKAQQRMQKLTKEQKSRVKIIFGHGIPYGIHKLFPQECRYITFVRNPMKRTISSYNFQKTRLLGNLSKKQYSYYMSFVGKQKIFSFNEWLTAYYDNLPQLPVGVTMTRFLQELGFLEKATQPNFEKLFSKFYFIGLTETYKEDTAYLYSLFGFRKFYANQNVSTSKLNPEEIAQSQHLLNKKNINDIKLYQKAVEHNQQLKKTLPWFYPISFAMQSYQTVNRPITNSSHQFLETLYRYSARVKKHSPLYVKVIKTIKASINA